MSAGIAAIALGAPPFVPFTAFVLWAMCLWASMIAWYGCPTCGKNAPDGGRPAKAEANGGGS